MKIIYLLILAILSVYVCRAEPILVHQHANDSIGEKAKKLRLLYKLSTSTSEGIKETYQQQFFNEFPNTFKQLNELYGYDKKPAILYEDAPKHILELFNKLTEINDTLYYRQIISIAIGGHWDAGAVNYFQHGLRERILNNMALTVYLLSNLSENSIKSFWYFYFDGAHPKKIVGASLEGIKIINPTIYNLMIEAHEDVLRKNQ